MPELSEDEGNAILQWGESYFEAGAIRYGFECWAWAALRWLKKKCHVELRERGRLPICSDPHDPLQRVDFELPARTEESWPFGTGRESKSKKPRYLQFRDVLQHRVRWMEWSSNYYNPRFLHPNAPPDITGKARGYCFVLPDLDVRAGDQPIPPSELAGLLPVAGKRSGKQLSMAEAYHALFVAARGGNLAHRYKRDVAARITRIAGALHAAHDALTTG